MAHGRLRNEQQTLKSDLPFGSNLLVSLSENGFSPNHIRKTGQRAWLLRVRTPEHIQDRYALAPELLLLAVHELQGRDLTKARREPGKADHRLDAGLVVVASTSKGLTPAHRLSFNGQLCTWPAPFDQPLARVLERDLPTYDVFDESRPVRGRGVIGRERDIDTLVRSVQDGRAVALLGLRKVGKSTVAFAAHDRLVEAGWRTAWVDVQALLGPTLGELSTALARSLPAPSPKPRSSPSDTSDPLVRLKRLLLQATRDGGRVALFIDEFDLLFEPEVCPGVRRLFALLRGLAQEGGAVSFVLVGRDPSHTQRARLEGVTNPLLGWLQPQWLAPLGPDEASVLLDRLARRVALPIDDETLTRAYCETGGHPYLLRQYGSALLAREREPSSHPHVHRESPTTRYRSRESVRGTCHEMADLLHDRYPDTLELARFLAEYDGEVQESQDAWETASEEARTWLRRFGLKLATAHYPRLLPTLAWYLRRYGSRFERVPA